MAVLYGSEVSEGWFLTRRRPWRAAEGWVARWLLLVIQIGIYGNLLRSLEDDYAYVGIGFRWPTPSGIIFCFLAVLLTAAFLPSEARWPSQACLWLLASFVVTPTLAVAAMNPRFSASTALTAAAVVLVGIAVLAFLAKYPPQTRRLGPALVADRRTYVTAAQAVAVVGSLVVIVGYGVTAFDLSFDTQYVRRLDARSAGAPFPGATYVVAWYKAVLLPLLAVVGLRWRVPSLLVMASLGSLLIFSYSGEKIVFVTPIIATLLYQVNLSGSNRCRVPWFGLSMTGALLIVPIVVDATVPTMSLRALLAQRIGVVPAQLTHTYVDYSREFGFTWFEQSYLRLLGRTGDSRSMGLRVGEWIDPAGELNANANLWADGYASAGMFGVVVSSVMLAVVLRGFDLIARSRDIHLVTPVIGAVCITYVNGYFHSSLLSGGVIFGLMCVWALPGEPEGIAGTSAFGPKPARRPQLT